MAPRRTYVVSLYDADNSIVVESVQRDERARIDDLDGLAARIREWEAASGASSLGSAAAGRGPPSGAPPDACGP